MLCCKAGGGEAQCVCVTLYLKDIDLPSQRLLRGGSMSLMGWDVGLEYRKFPIFDGRSDFQKNVGTRTD